MLILVTHITLTWCFSRVMKLSSVAVFGWEYLVIVGIHALGWASTVSVVGGTSSDGTGRSVNEYGRKTSSLKMLLSNGHIPEDLNRTVMLHGMTAFAHASPTSSFVER